MIHVLATITVKPGKRDGFLAIFKDNIPNVRAEAGCLEYTPAVDHPTDIQAQGMPRPDTAVIIEMWETMGHLKDHLAASHMAAYREKVKDLVEHVDLQILRPA